MTTLKGVAFDGYLVACDVRLISAPYSLDSVMSTRSARQFSSDPSPTTVSPICAACIEVHSNYVNCMSAPATCVYLDVSSFQAGQNTGTIPTAIGTLTALTYL